jgi:hypothetical protein
MEPVEIIIFGNRARQCNEGDIFQVTKHTLDGKQVAKLVRVGTV